MKTTELFDKKMEILFGKSDPLEKEFLNQNIYFGKYPKNGLTVKALKLILPEVFSYRIRVLGFDAVNSDGEIYSFCWEDYEKYYINEWILKAISEIEEKNENVRLFLYLDFPGKVIRKFKGDFED